MMACDFFTIETMWLKRIYVLVYIELDTRRVQLSGCTTNPDGGWVTQQARNFTFHLDERAQPLRFLIHDRDSKFCGPFDEVFATEVCRWFAHLSGRLVPTPSASDDPNREDRVPGLASHLLQAPPRARPQDLHSPLQPTATSPCAATSNTGAGGVQEDAASR